MSRHHLKVEPVFPFYLFERIDLSGMELRMKPPGYLSYFSQIIPLLNSEQRQDLTNVCIGIADIGIYGQSSQQVELEAARDSLYLSQDIYRGCCSGPCLGVD